MYVTVTQAALDVIRHALMLAGKDPSEVGVRLRSAGGAVRPTFVTEPRDGDVVVEDGGVRIFLDPRIRATVIDVSPEHQQLIVR